jgi:hypothetical protein
VKLSQSNIPCRLVTACEKVSPLTREVISLLQYSPRLIAHVDKEAIQARPGGLTSLAALYLNAG